ncbi:MAG: D-alanyl-D-alanine carboxypeptidase [Anaerostipes sp.]|nr:D-alanyl-D-alanine carboxypeptidase [Anaerostipes sp.]
MKQGVTKRIFCLGFIMMAFLSLFQTRVGAVTTNQSNDSVDLVGKSAIVMDLQTQTILYEKDINVKHYPASITKIMTALLTIENCKGDETVTFSNEAVNGIERGSSAALVNIGEKITVDQALHGLLLISANDIAAGLAEHVSGTQSAFAEKMTEKAKELGCKNTHFVNPHGLNNEQHYTTAYDMALIAKKAYSKEEFRKIIKTTYYQLPKTNKSKVARNWYNSNRMIQQGTAYYDSRCLGGKTGYTIAAGETLVTFGNINGRVVICVVLQSKNSASAYVDSSKLYDYTKKNMDVAALEAKDSKTSATTETKVQTTEKKTNVSSNEKTKGIFGTYIMPNKGIIIKVIVVLAVLLVLRRMHTIRMRKKRRAEAAKRRRKKRK